MSEEKFIPISDPKEAVKTLNQITEMYNEWRDIKDAPKDGTSIITIVQGHQPCVTEWVQLYDKARFCTDPEIFMEQEHFEEYFHKSNYEPTHWMPLIPGPTSQEGGK